MDFKINEIVTYRGIDAEILAIKSDLKNKVKIKLTMNEIVVKNLSYTGNFNYLIITNKKMPTI